MKPSKVPISLALVLLLLSLATLFFKGLFWIWVYSAIGLFALLLLDLLLLFSLDLPQIRRLVPQTLPVGEPTVINLEIFPQPRSPRKILLFDHYPSTFQIENLPLVILIPWAKKELKITAHYRATPTERGNHSFPFIQGLARSPWGLWWRNFTGKQADRVKVYPNFQTVSRYTLLSLLGKTSQLGIIRHQKRGLGLEFHQLREYRSSDTIRQIDWKATSKHRKLISREYTDEQNQQVIFLLDTGYKMHAKDAALAHFDFALNAMLLLAYVALRGGDLVGIQTFGSENIYLSPLKGVSSINTILNATFDLQSSNAPSDLGSALTELLSRVKRRSLFIIISNIREEDTENLLGAVKSAAHRHVILAASLREKALDSALEQPVSEFKTALQVAAVHDYLLRRKEMIDQLLAAGLFYVDVTPEELTAALVNHYLDIKSKNLL